MKERFNFGPSDHAYFMGWVGLCYALSQGVHRLYLSPSLLCKCSKYSPIVTGIIAKYLIRLSGEDPTNVLLVCIMGLSMGRVYAMTTSSIYGLYAVMAAVIVALVQLKLIYCLFICLLKYQLPSGSDEYRDILGLQPHRKRRRSWWIVWNHVIDN